MIASAEQSLQDGEIWMWLLQYLTKYWKPAKFGCGLLSTRRSTGLQPSPGRWTLQQKTDYWWTTVLEGRFLSTRQSTGKRSTRLDDVTNMANLKVLSGVNPGHFVKTTGTWNLHLHFKICSWPIRMWQHKLSSKTSLYKHNSTTTDTERDRERETERERDERWERGRWTYMAGLIWNVQ